MSIASTIKELREENTKLRASLDLAKKTPTEAVVAQLADRDKKIETFLADNQRLEQERNANAQLIGEKDRVITQKEAQIAELTAQTAALDSAVSGLQATEKRTRELLQNPALVDAAMIGVSAIDLGTADAPDSNASDKTACTLWDQYYALLDPAERRAFYLAHDQGLQDELKQKR